jgi:hypothetical protein
MAEWEMALEAGSVDAAFANRWRVNTSTPPANNDPKRNLFVFIGCPSGYDNERSATILKI